MPAPSAQNPTPVVTGNRIVRRLNAAKRLGISNATIDRWVREGHIIKPTRIGPRACGWSEAYLDALIAGTAEQSNPQK